MEEMTLPRFFALLESHPNRTWTAWEAHLGVTPSNRTPLCLPASNTAKLQWQKALLAHMALLYPSMSVHEAVNQWVETAHSLPMGLKLILDLIRPGTYSPRPYVIVLGANKALKLRRPLLEFMTTKAWNLAVHLEAQR